MSAAGMHAGLRALPLLVALQLLALGTCTTSAFAELLCSPEDGTDPVRYRDPAGEIWNLVDFRFSVPSWQRPHLACNRWVESLGLVGQLEVRALYGAGRQSSGRLEGRSRRDLYRACAQSHSCRVRFPYNLYPDPGFLWTQVRSRVRSSPSLPALCAGPERARPLAAREALSKPLAQRPLLTGLSEVKTWFTPVTQFGQEVASVVRDTHEGQVFVSTMTVEPAEVRRISVPLQRTTAPEVFLVFDLNTVLAEGPGGLDLFRDGAHGVHLVPFFNSPQFAKYYHIKGAASVGGDDGRLVFTGANLKTYDRMALFDLGFTARGREAATALASVIARQARRACASAPMLECTLAARFPPDSAWPQRIRGALRESCTALQRTGVGTNARKSANPFVTNPFVVSDRHDLVPEVLNAIASAKRSIVGSTYHLDQPQVIEALAAREHQVITRVAVGRGDKRRRWVERRSSFASYLSDEQTKGLQPHTKALLVDGETLLWGSGNLTRGGLGGSLEIMFYTREPALVAAYRRYLGTLARLAGQAHVDQAPPLAPTPAATAVYLPKAERRQLDRVAPSWRRELAPARRGLGGFYRASGDLERCLVETEPQTLIHSAQAVSACLQGRS